MDILNEKVSQKREHLFKKNEKRAEEPEDPFDSVSLYNRQSPKTIK